MSSNHTPFLIIISAPSGCGKTTLINELFNKVDGLGISISHTTREPRFGEKNGVDYHFVDQTVFSQMQEAGQFVESALVHGNFYGTTHYSVKHLLDNGYDVVLDIDVQGMKKVKLSQQFCVVTVFILPPSIEDLEVRLLNRHADSETVIRRRLENSIDEISQANLYDYIVLNQQVSKAANDLTSIINAERTRISNSLLLKKYYNFAKALQTPHLDDRSI